MVSQRAMPRHRASRRELIAGHATSTLVRNIDQAKQREAATAAHVEKTANWLQLRFAPQLNFARKIMDDGVTNFAGMLAYSLLLAVAPLLLGVLGIVSIAYFLTGHTSASLTKFITQRLSSAIPASGVSSFAVAIQHDAVTIGVLGVVTAIIA